MIDEILLIDDDEITLLICETVIENEAFANKVSTCKNGQEAICYFYKLIEHKKQQPDVGAPQLLLLDLNMPFMNGWEFLEEFERYVEPWFPEVKICILTSSVDPLDITHAKVYQSVIGFINKPMTAERIQEMKENEHLAHLFTAS